MSPEILQYQDGDTLYTNKVDIFSAGIILYALLTKKKPFQTKTKDIKETIRLNKECNFDFTIEELKK